MRPPATRSETVVDRNSATAPWIPSSNASAFVLLTNVKLCIFSQEIVDAQTRTMPSGMDVHVPTRCCAIDQAHDWNMRLFASNADALKKPRSPKDGAIVFRISGQRKKPAHALSGERGQLHWT